MKAYCLYIYLDSLRAGHAYLELQKPQEAQGKVYGFYPEKFDEKREVLFGKGMLREDRERLDSSQQNGTISQTGKELQLTEEEFARLENFLEEQCKQPNTYFLVGYNCIDFIQDAYVAAKGRKEDHFLKLYNQQELEKLSWVGTYAKLVKSTKFIAALNS